MLPEDDRMIEIRRSVLKCFNVNFRLLKTKDTVTVTLARNRVCSLRMIVGSKHVGAFKVF